ncbi:metal ABC transporter permease, partial [Bacillus subtilis]|nr:metal ABC transporter permease [Bacillus subtilis]
MAAFFNEWGSVIWEGLLQTATMTIISLIIAIIIGLPMGIFLVMTRPGGQA